MVKTIKNFLNKRGINIKYSIILTVVFWNPSEACETSPGWTILANDAPWNECFIGRHISENSLTNEYWLDKNTYYRHINFLNLGLPGLRPDLHSDVVSFFIENEIFTRELGAGPRIVESENSSLIIDTQIYNSNSVIKLESPSIEKEDFQDGNEGVHEISSLFQSILDASQILDEADGRLAINVIFPPSSRY